MKEESPQRKEILSVLFAASLAGGKPRRSLKIK